MRLTVSIFLRLLLIPIATVLAEMTLTKTMASDFSYSGLKGLPIPYHFATFTSPTAPLPLVIAAVNFLVWFLIGNLIIDKLIYHPWRTPTKQLMKRLATYALIGTTIYIPLGILTRL